MIRLVGHPLEYVRVSGVLVPYFRQGKPLLWRVCQRDVLPKNVVGDLDNFVPYRWKTKGNLGP